MQHFLASHGYVAVFLDHNGEAVASGSDSRTSIIAAVLAIALVLVILRLRTRSTRADGARPAARRNGWRLKPPARNRRPLAISRQRRALRQAVSAAEFAVLAAQQAGAQTGNLDALCQRLRLAAQDVDRSLFPARPGPASLTSAGLHSAIGDLVTAAGLIQDAAAFAVASQAQPAATVEEDARSRAEAIAASIAQGCASLGKNPPAGES